ncbi:MAG: T9SS type A sorting domain-containing protein [Candidatus Cloacimonetes bacterium]|nr:T9SS type A sorting domain-containing protein [Candidatus Cloacimonadota bacterium]
MEKKVFLLVFSLFCAGIVNAAILNVPSEYPTIQTSIDSSSTGDTVLVQPGTYVENINYNGKNITVASLFLTTQDTSFISQTIIDGNNVDTVVKFQNGEDSTAMLCGFKITHGWTNLWGGGIYTGDSSPKIAYNYICDNRVDYWLGISEGGGGIYCTGGSPLIYNNKIFNNIVENGYGGGIQCWSSSPEIKNTEIYNNYSDEEELFGGGISYLDSSEVNIVNCNIHDNIAIDGGGVYCNNTGGKIKNSVIDNNDMVSQYTGCGGGVYCKSNSELIFSGVKISNHSYNDQGEYGGGVYCSNSNMTFNNCEFINNLSNFGGGIYCVSNSHIECDNTNFYTNEGGNSGGCFFCDNSTMILSNSIIDGSDAFSYGGAMYVLNNSYVCMDSVSLISNVSSVGGGIRIDNSDIDIYSSCFYNNSACDGGAIISFNSDLNIFNSLFVENGTYEGGSAIDARSGSDVYCCNVTITDNYAQTSCGGIKCSSNSNLEMYNSILWNDTQPEIIGNNVSIMYSDIQGDWIGVGNIDIDPMFADTLNEDYRLTENSLCIDAGISDTTGLNIPPSDMDGNKRVWDGNGDGIAVIDMGAYEYAAPPFSIDPQIIPNKLLMYNFPNPVQNSSTIQYSLKQNSHVKITIYNIKGQLISTLMNEYKPKGEHSVNFNTRKLKSGVYFYKIETDYITEIKKIVVIK